MQYYYFVIVAGIYLGTNTHTDDASAKLNIPTILLEQFGLQEYLGPVTVYKRCLFHTLLSERFVRLTGLHFIQVLICWFKLCHSKARKSFLALERAERLTLERWTKIKRNRPAAAGNEIRAVFYLSLLESSELFSANWKFCAFCPCTLKCAVVQKANFFYFLLIYLCDTSIHGC